MAIEYKKNTAVFDAVVSVEDAENLLQWILQHPKGKLDLTTCTHLHAAVLQVAMAARLKVAAWPVDNDLADWIKSALKQ